MERKKIAIIGGGTMGSAIAKRLLNDKIFLKSQMTVTVRRKERAKELEQASKLPTSIDSVAAFQKSDIVLFCIKPQNLDSLLEQIERQQTKHPDKLVVSIVAGISIDHFRRYLSPQTRIVRAMPNTPCLIGAGITVVSCGPGVTLADKKWVSRIFGALGDFLELPEQHMDTVTGLSASGPAFVYVIIEALADGGVMRGLPRKIAVQLAASTLLGAAKMVLDTGRHPADLKDEVTTPAGCTIGALLHMEDGRIRSVLARGVEEAAKIAGRLADTHSE